MIFSLANGINHLFLNEYIYIQSYMLVSIDRCMSIFLFIAILPPSLYPVFTIIQWWGAIEGHEARIIGSLSLWGHHRSPEIYHQIWWGEHDSNRWVRFLFTCKISHEFTDGINLKFNFGALTRACKCTRIESTQAFN